MTVLDRLKVTIEFLMIVSIIGFMIFLSKLLLLIGCFCGIDSTWMAGVDSISNGFSIFSKSSLSNEELELNFSSSGIEAIVKLDFYLLKVGFLIIYEKSIYCKNLWWGSSSSTAGLNSSSTEANWTYLGFLAFIMSWLGSFTLLLLSHNWSS